MGNERKLTFSINAEQIEGKPKPGELEVVGITVEMDGKKIAEKTVSRIRGKDDVGEFAEDVMHGLGNKPDAEDTSPSDA